MKRGLKAALLGALAVAMATQATAATLKPSTMKDGRIIVLISGEIKEGDSDAFKAAVKAANDAGKLVSSVRLNSPGAAMESQPTGGAPFLMSMGPERVSGTFNLTRQDEADDMIRRLTALKAFLKPNDEAAN